MTRSFNFSRVIAFIGVSLIITFCYLPYMFIFLPELKKSSIAAYWFLMTTINIGVIMIFLTYFYAVFTNPGYNAKVHEMIIEEFELNEIKSESQKLKVEINSLKKQKHLVAINNTQDSKYEEHKLNNQLNSLYLSNIKKLTFCFHCQEIKPPRCHHCRSCNKCILKMDHHCPWTGNCVGQENLKYFIQFLFYASLILLSHFVSELVLYFLVIKNQEKYDDFIALLIIFNSIFSTLVGLAIGYLFVYQVNNATVNLTTVEDNIEGARELKPFDLGLKGNVERILGNNWRMIDLFFPTVVKN